MGTITRFQERSVLLASVSERVIDISREFPAIGQYLGHRNIAHTVRYTELSPERFKEFWKD